MKIKQLYKAFEISELEIDENSGLLHKHHFFQMVYVLEGTGKHIINENAYEIATGSLFLLTPDDEHSFKPEGTFKCCLIDFTRNFFDKNSQKEYEIDLSSAFHRMEYIFHHHDTLQGELIQKEDQHLAQLLIHQLIKENKETQSFNYIIIQNVLFLLLNLIVRTIQQHQILQSKIKDADSKIFEILSYIQHHIYDHNYLSIEHLAQKFTLSKGYISRYFKEKYGNTIKGFIIQYKLELVINRLKYSDLTISEIAHELQFTDDSHLNKAFKNKYGKTAKQYKKEILKR